MVHSFSSLWSYPSPSVLDQTMRCLSCNCNLSDREANRKFENWEEIKNPESRYITLCDDCILDTDLVFEEDPKLSSDKYEASNFEEPIEIEPSIWDDR